MELKIPEPANAQTAQALAEAAAQIYAEAVLQELLALACPQTQKLELLAALRKYWQEQS